MDRAIVDPLPAHGIPHIDVVRRGRADAIHLACLWSLNGRIKSLYSIIISQDRKTGATERNDARLDIDRDVLLAALNVGRLVSRVHYPDDVTLKKPCRAVGILKSDLNSIRAGSEGLPRERCCNGAAAERHIAACCLAKGSEKPDGHG